MNANHVSSFVFRVIPAASGINVFKKIYKSFEKYSPIITLLFLPLGIGIASKSAIFADIIDRGMSGLIDVYQYLAPIAIYIILTPSLTKILLVKAGNGMKFAGNTILAFVKLRLWACIWGAVFTAIFFGLPLYLNATVGFWESTLVTVKSIGWMLTHSFYLFALYAAIVTVVISLKVTKISFILNKAVEGIETAGRYFIPLVPLFMLAIGAYIYYLPQSIQEQITSNGGSIAHLNNLKIFGFDIHTYTASGMFLAYLAGGLLTGLACMVWHYALLLITKYRERNFSIKQYFRNYWVRVYPLLWSTSSEALATPLNLHLVEQYYPQIRPEVRRFVIGTGSFLNINGTIICVFILAGLTTVLLGIKISFIQLVLIIPLVFLIGYSIPGIPGELLIFAGPIASLLAIPESTIPAFLAIYLGFQLGLPDSFRTGCNSTDNCVYAILLDKTYKEKFEIQRKEVSR